jgi:iron-sulfur cluster assembly accessory protein
MIYFIMTTIQITRSAWLKITEILVQTKNPYGFLYSVKTGGCNGFNFELDPLTKNIHQKIKGTKFLTILQNNESSVYIDPLSEMYLLGTTIDYVKEDFSQKIYESKFIYDADKNIMTKCGCGTSFSPKTI